ncbi:beta-lactamase-like protein [Cunninghamella echinulata]|nr:beta-lactamase-like protein [Cunninghamella echinulata]
MVELIHYHSNLGSHISPDTAPYDYLKQIYEDHDDWRLIYTLKDVSSCIEKILPVRYKEKLSLFSTLDITPYSAGYSLGSSHWLIETSMKKIAVLGNGSLRTELHPSDFDTSIFYSADVILVSGIISTINTMDTSRLYDLQLNKLLGHVASTLGARQNVILPIRITSGLLYDLIWMIKSHLYTLGMEIGSESHQIPIYVLSPVAEQSLQYANICGEWMTNDFQEHLWKPEMPLPHGELLKSGALTTFSDIIQLKMKSFQQPCIIFCGDHQCLEKGPTQWFLQQWNNNNTDNNHQHHHLCILTDIYEQQQQVEINSPITTIHTPLDIRLNHQSLHDLLQLHWSDSSDGTKDEKYRLKHLILPKPFDHSSTDLWDQSSFNNSNVQVTWYSSGEMIDIDIDIQWEQIMISNKLAKNIKLKPIPWTPSDGKIITMAPISGQVYVYNNQLLLKESNTISLNRDNMDWLLSNTNNSMSLNEQQIDVQAILSKLHKVNKQ